MHMAARRRSLGAEAFGFNVVDLAPGGELPAHDEAESGQEEVFVVLEGEATIVADDEERAAGPGTFVRYGPAVARTVEELSDAPSACC